MNIFSWLTKKPTMKIEEQVEVFSNIYQNLQSSYESTKDLNMCLVQIDVSNSGYSVDEWVRVINRNLHFYNKVYFKIKAFKSVDDSWLFKREFLNIELLDVPEHFSGKLKA